MFDAIKIALLVLQIVDKFFDYYRDRGLISQGHQEEIAATAQRIAVKTGVRKVVWEKVDALSPDEIDAELRGLEPPDAGAPKPMHPGTG